MRPDNTPRDPMLFPIERCQQNELDAAALDSIAHRLEVLRSVYGRDLDSAEFRPIADAVRSTGRAIELSPQRPPADRHNPDPSCVTHPPQPSERRSAGDHSAELAP